MCKQEMQFDIESASWHAAGGGDGIYLVSRLHVGHEPEIVFQVTT